MLNRRKYVLLDDTAGTPAAGGAAPAESLVSSDIDWLAESSDSTESAPAASPASAPATPAAPAAPVVGAPAAPAAPVAPPATPPAQPSAPAASTPPATPPAPGTPGQPEAPAPGTPPTSAQPQVDYAALRTAELARLTTSYAISEDQARDIMVAPEQHLPALLANVHLQVFDEVARVILPRIPILVQQAQANLVAKSANEDAFYSEWPLLKNPQYAASVENAIRAYRQLNPRATRAEVIRAAGLTASITHRLEIPQSMFSQPIPSAPPAPGFSHAAPGAVGSSAHAPGTPGARNPYELLNEQFDNDLTTVG